MPAGPAAERLERALHPWTTFLVIPASALAALLGSAILWVASRHGSEEASRSDTVTDS